MIRQNDTGGDDKRMPDLDMFEGRLQRLRIPRVLKKRLPPVRDQRKKIQTAFLAGTTVIHSSPSTGGDLLRVWWIGHVCRLRWRLSRPTSLLRRLD